MNKDFTPAIIVFAFGCLGIILAAIVKVLHDGGVLVDEFITGTITLPELMAVIVVFFTIIGVIAAVMVKG